MGEHADRVIEINPDGLVITLVRWDLTDDLRFNEYTPLLKAGVLFSRVRDLDRFSYQGSGLYDHASFLDCLSPDRLLGSFVRFNSTPGKINTSRSAD